MQTLLIPFGADFDVPPTNNLFGIRGQSGQWFDIYLNEETLVGGSCDGKETLVGSEQSGLLDAYIDEIKVDEELRNHGVGTRLIQCFFKYCVELNMDSITSDIVDPAALAIRRKVHGENAIHFYETFKDEHIELPITIEQAQRSLQRALDTNGEPSAGIRSRVYLGDVDTGSWEMPVAVVKVKV
jgi:GNAT superfamily N-acetyltransferase